uniref:PCRF domain-containing protein n=1 Tax=Steinernema glaseri TaxID=37863 RepID=A0A1I8AE96_9BILA
MYLRYAEHKGFKAEILEQSDGDVAGIKSATIKIEGDYAYGFLRTETGVHRLCQNDRSQHRNRAEAMQMLKSRLYELEMRNRMAEQQKLEDSKSDVGWGHQIRSYVLDQSRIKDLRTNYESSNTQKILDGDLDPFIQASLKQGI